MECFFSEPRSALYTFTFTQTPWCLVVEATATTIYPSAGALAADSNLRIASLTMAAYDYLITLPAEYRLYKSSNRRSLGFILFVLIRYTSIIVLVVSNVGFFYHGFTPKACEHYHLAAPALKVVQMMVSQAILAIRTYGISQGNLWVVRTLLSTYILGAAFQWFPSLNSRIPVMTDGNCTVASAHPQSLISTWSFYLVAMLYDCLTLSISAVYLMKVKSVAPSTSRLFKILLYDGLGYFVVLTFTNLANILIFRGTDHLLQSTGAPFEYSVTWIMSQRIFVTPVVLAPLPSPRAVTSASRFEKGMKHQKRAKQGHTPGSQDQFSNTKSDLELQVRIDKSIHHGGC
ncbi:hypothetical protein EDB92DRAFT_435436 [Lactarius akahatsu]|uniref:DUF6533 domain-containing protein n=1 Tax=Lactarius akahatsu TaxID=416441 RepID=A0AAD4LIZ6_9AGAM|nr:hypothetical protein EDB92DRAFT_435436 [Lactarius akahatsu]